MPSGYLHYLILFTGDVTATGTRLPFLEFDGDNVVFPCGAIADYENDRLRLYYGDADTSIGLAEGSLSEIILGNLGVNYIEKAAERNTPFFCL